MAEDKRELILLRLEAILRTIAEGTGTYVWRDRAEFDERLETFPGSGVLAELPCYTLLDGNETQLTKSTDRRGPQIMLLQPQMFYVPVPTENPLNVGVGSDLSAKRMTFIKAFMQDGQLRDLLGDNGFVEYRGMETDMQTGAEVKGQFRIDFDFAYVLNFNKL